MESVGVTHTCNDNSEFEKDESDTGGVGEGKVVEML